MRHAVAFLIAATVAGCSAAEETPEGRGIDCALGGTDKFLPDCFVEDSRAGNRRFLTVRNKTGTFRRFEIVDNGRGIIAADGADEAIAKWTAEGVLQVAVGKDRYRFPARMKSDAPQP